MKPRPGFRLLYLWLALAALAVVAAFFFDADLHSWMTAHQSRSGKVFMRNVSRWGDWPLHFAVGIIGAAIAYALKSRRWAVTFLAMVLALALAGLATRTIKVAAGRSRPSVKATATWSGPTFSQKYHAFPSGHTVATSAFFGVLLLARRRIGLALLPIPLLIASSRIYLNAHYLSDVVFGMFLGFCCAWLAWWILSRRFLADQPAPVRTR